MLDKLAIAFISCITCGLIFFFIEKKITLSFIYFFNNIITGSFESRKEKLERLICIKEPKEKTYHVRQEAGGNR